MWWISYEFHLWLWVKPVREVSVQSAMTISTSHTFCYWGSGSGHPSSQKVQRLKNPDHNSANPEMKTITLDRTRELWTTCGHQLTRYKPGRRNAHPGSVREAVVTSSPCAVSDGNKLKFVWSLKTSALFLPTLFCHAGQPLSFPFFRPFP